MSATTLCPQADLTCDACIETFLDEHPGAEVWEHTYHWCDCPYIATVDERDICIGCGDRRNLAGEHRHLMAGRAA